MEGAISREVTMPCGLELPTVTRWLLFCLRRLFLAFVVEEPAVEGFGAGCLRGRFPSGAEEDEEEALCGVVRRGLGVDDRRGCGWLVLAFHRRYAIRCLVLYVCRSASVYERGERAAFCARRVMLVSENTPQS